MHNKVLKKTHLGLKNRVVPDPDLAGNPADGPIILPTTGYPTGRITGYQARKTRPCLTCNPVAKARDTYLFFFL